MRNGFFGVEDVDIVLINFLSWDIYDVQRILKAKVHGKTVFITAFQTGKILNAVNDFRYRSCHFSTAFYIC